VVILLHIYVGIFEFRINLRSVFYHRDPPPRDGGGALELDQLSLESSLPRSLQLPELDGGGAEPPAALLK